RTQTVTGDINYVVDAAHDPEIALPVLARAVAGEIDAVDLRPVLLLIPRIVTVNRPQHRRPGLGNYEVSTLVRPHGFPLASHHVSFNSGKRLGRRTGFCRRRARQWRDHDCTGLSLPPRVDYGATFFTNDPVIPHPGL